jgi:hypothetical protein
MKSTLQRPGSVRFAAELCQSLRDSPGALYARPNPQPRAHGRVRPGAGRSAGWHEMALSGRFDKRFRLLAVDFAAPYATRSDV